MNDRPIDAGPEEGRGVGYRVGTVAFVDNSDGFIYRQCIPLRNSKEEIQLWVAGTSTASDHRARLQAACHPPPVVLRRPTNPRNRMFSDRRGINP